MKNKTPPAQRPREPRHGEGFNRRLLSVIRDPVEPLSRVLCRELKTPSLTTLRNSLTPESIATLRVATCLAVAFSRLIIVQDWRRYLRTSGLPLSKATTQYVRLLRRSHVEISMSSLYYYRHQFMRHGLEGLVPRWRGGRPRRIPAADRALLCDLLRQPDLYSLYRLARRHARLAGRPITALAARQVISDFVGSDRAIHHARRLKGQSSKDAA